MSEENKAIARRYFEEAINQRNLNALDEIFAAEFVDHTATPEQAPGRSISCASRTAKLRNCGARRICSA